MRNLRKLTAVVVAIALVLTSMATAFAASTTYEFEAQATVLKDLGIWTGNASGDLMLGKELTRAEGAVLVLKTVLGKTEADMEAADVTSIDTFADAAKVPSWAEGWIALAVEAGVVKGSDNKLNAAAPLLGKDLASMFMNALGFSAENDYAKAVELLAAKATITSISAKIPAGDALLRDAATAIVTDALTAKAKDAKETVIVKYVGSDASLKAIAEKAGLIAIPAADLVVESITALNAKQIEVKFNKDMDKDSAETESFYSVKDKGGSTETTLGSSSAALVDSKTVVISLNNAITDKLTNSSTAKIKVKKDIKAADGKKLAADKELDVVVQDGILPTVSKIEATGEKNIRLTFSEPVYGGDSGTYGASGNFKDNFVVKSGTYTYFVQNVTISGITATLDLGTSLIEGPVVVTVNKDGSTATAVQDYAGYKIFKGDSTFNYVKDTSVAVVSISSAKPNEVKVKFSKPVKAADLRLFHSVKGVAAYCADVVTTNNNYLDEITFTFPINAVPPGDISFFLVNSSTAGNELVDGYGVKVPDQTLTAKVVADVTGPVVSSTELDTNVAFKITFDEALTSSSIDKKNITFKSVSDGKDVFYNLTNDADRKVLTLTVPGNLADNTQYQVVVKSAEDMYGNKMAAEATFTFTTGDNTAPSVNNDDCYAVGSDGKIYIFFSEPMNEAQMLDKNNYAVATSYSISVLAALGTDDTVTKLSEKAVVIDMASTVNQPLVKIAPIMDLAGKRLGNSLDAVLVKNNNYQNWATSTYIKAESVLIESAKLIAKNKVKVTFDKELSSFANTDITFTTDGSVFDAIKVQMVESSVKNSDGKTEVVLVLDKEMATDAKYNNTRITCGSITTPNSISISGTKLQGKQEKQVADLVAPEVVKTTINGTDVPSVIFTTTAALNISGKVAKGDDLHIAITFSESIKSATLSTLTFKVEGYTVTAISNGTDGNVVTITAKANDAVTPYTTVTQVYNITDSSPDANVLASGTVWSVTK